MFDNPCIPIVAGFDTGVHETGSVNSDTNAGFKLVVTDAQPL
jgi:hypothetical protein